MNTSNQFSLGLATDSLSVLVQVTALQLFSKVRLELFTLVWWYGHKMK